MIGKYYAVRIMLGPVPKWLEAHPNYWAEPALYDNLCDACIIDSHNHIQYHVDIVAKPFCKKIEGPTKIEVVRFKLIPDGIVSDIESEAK